MGNLLIPSVSILASTMGGTSVDEEGWRVQEIPGLGCLAYWGEMLVGRIFEAGDGGDSDEDGDENGGAGLRENALDNFRRRPAGIDDGIVSCRCSSSPASRPRLVTISNLGFSGHTMIGTAKAHSIVMQWGVFVK